MPSKPGPLEKGPGCIKVVSYRCAWWKELALCEIVTSCCSSKRPHRLICHRLALLIFRRFNHLFQHEMWEKTTPNYLNFFFLLEVSFWTFLNPPFPKICQKGCVTISQEFLFWKCNQAWVQICSQVYSCQEGGTLTLKPTPVNHAGQLCW